MPLDLSEARSRHRRGDIASAARAYESALAAEPDHPEALYLLGLVALQSGDVPRALKLMGRAASLRPEEADFLAGLAEAERASGRLDRAIALAREAVRLRPDGAEDRCNLGALLSDRGEADAAIDCFREAIRLRPDLAAAHHNLAHALWKLGRHEDALAHQRTAVGLDPGSAEAHANLGAILLQQTRAAEALGPCREAVRLAPANPLGRVQLGNALLMLGRLDEAEASFREAVRLAPGLAVARACLATALEQAGDLPGALASLREAVRLDMGHAGALARLATRLRGDLPDADLATIEALLARPDLPAEAAGPLRFGLAQVLDARGEFDRAAAEASAANAWQEAELRRRGRAYDPGAFGAFVSAVIGAYTPEFFERARGWGDPSTRPVFVVGMPRSGTSLAEQVLASHPDAFGAGELTAINDLVLALPSLTGPASSLGEALGRLRPEHVRDLAGRYLAAIAALDGPAARVVDKMPENYLHLGLIATLFPGARIIHCRRDPRDVALSCWLTDFGHLRWASDAGHIRGRIGEYRRLMAHWRRVLPVAVFDLDYEAFVRDPEPHARALLAAAGLGWDPACLEFHRSPRPVRTASLAQVRRPIYAGSVGRWEPYRRALPALFEGLGDSDSRGDRP
jgi:tetratricopeptide (TPR) repeat protein